MWRGIYWSWREAVPHPITHFPWLSLRADKQLRHSKFGAKKPNELKLDIWFLKGSKQVRLATGCMVQYNYSACLSSHQKIFVSVHWINFRAFDPCDARLLLHMRCIWNANSGITLYNAMMHIAPSSCDVAQYIEWRGSKQSDYLQCPMRSETAVLTANKLFTDLKAAEQRLRIWSSLLLTSFIATRAGTSYTL